MRTDRRWKGSAAAAIHRKAQTISSLDYIASFRSALRHVLQRVPNVRAVVTAGAPLERLPGEAEPPHLLDAEVIEDATVRPRVVPGSPEPGFAAFLDGAQESQVLAWVGPAPIVYGTVAAVVRRRLHRRLATWGAPVVERRIYAPLAYAPRDVLVESFASALVDTTRPAHDGTVPPPHPILLLERAKFAVSRDREDVERRLGEQWCATEHEPLMLDGGVGGSNVIARAPCVVGVVKSHRTLYVSGAALDAVLALRSGERSSVIRIAPRDRSSVHSWYLRLRDFTGCDALWGLVRVEVAASDEDVTARADQVSRWVLAEAAPLAMPDPRWDKMAYGVHNCEAFLRAVM